MKPRLLILDRDGTIIVEPPEDFQVDSLEKLAFLPHAISSLRQVSQQSDFHWLMVTNQDGLGTASFPEQTFWPAHQKMLDILAGEGITFADILIDRSFAHQNLPTRKPQTGLLTHYQNGDFDLERSYVIGDRLTDIELAKNLGTRAIWIHDAPEDLPQDLAPLCDLVTTDWQVIRDFLCEQPQRIAHLQRHTNETRIDVRLNLDGTGKADIKTGLGFFDHMLEQIARHGGVDLFLRTQGDLHVDEHHTIEDTALALGAAIDQALGQKRGIQRYGFLLPMDEAQAQVALDLGGDMPTEMFFHFFKSLSDQARCTLHIQASGTNEHHKIEAIFKGFARALAMAKSHTGNQQLPTTKGLL